MGITSNLVLLMDSLATMLIVARSENSDYTVVPSMASSIREVQYRLVRRQVMSELVKNLDQHRKGLKLL